MKIKFLLFPVLALAFACQNTPKEITETQTEEIVEEVAMVNVQKVELNINGMTCTGCESAVQKAIDEFEGVYTSKANHKNSIAILEFDSTKVDLLKIEEAINELGYEAQGYSVLPE